MVPARLVSLIASRRWSPPKLPHLQQALDLLLRFRNTGPSAIPPTRYVYVPPPQSAGAQAGLGSAAAGQQG